MNVYEQVKTVVPRRYRHLARDVWCDAMAPLFAGTAVECPACEKSSRRWVSLGLDDAMCPRCMSEPRHRLLALYMRQELPLTPAAPTRILHFAAEHCFIRRFRSMPNVEHIIADLDPPRGGVRMDITDIPLDRSSVDLVICSHVLEHVQDDRRAMRELRRVLRPGGTALIMVPVDCGREITYEDPSIVTPKARREAFHQSDHVRVYGADFEHRLRHAGFDVDATRYGDRSNVPAARYGLDPNEVLYVCR